MATVRTSIKKTTVASCPVPPPEGEAAKGACSSQVSDISFKRGQARFGRYMQGPMNYS